MTCRTRGPHAKPRRRWYVTARVELAFVVMANAFCGLETTPAFQVLALLYTHRMHNEVIIWGISPIEETKRWETRKTDAAEGGRG